MSKIEKNWLEWCIFAVASVVVCGALGYLIYDSWTQTQKPAVLKVFLGESEARAGYFVLPVTVSNRGDQTAEAVHVEVVLTKQDGSKSRAGLQMGYLSRQGSRHGFVTFETDPDTAKRVVVRPLGYRVP